MEDAAACLERLARSYSEFKLAAWQPYEPTPADEKRLASIVYCAPWRGSASERMERLLSLAPLAIQQAATLPAAANASINLWAIIRTADDVKRLADAFAATREDQPVVLTIQLPGEAFKVLTERASRQGRCAAWLAAELIGQGLDQTDRAS